MRSSPKDSSPNTISQEGCGGQRSEIKDEQRPQAARGTFAELLTSACLTRTTRNPELKNTQTP
jgi:hypothetical protein